MKRWCRLSILTDEVSQELSDVLRFARDFSLEGIELRSLFGKPFRDLSPTEIAEIGARCRDAGVLISGCATPVFKCDLDDKGAIDEHVELFRRSLESARALGSELVRVFTFIRRSHPATSDEIARAAAVFPRLLEIARGSGITIGVENEASCIVGSGSEMREFLNHLPKDPELGVVWDPCNVLYLDGTNDPVHTDFPMIADQVRHVHIKDARRKGDRAAKTCVEVGTGAIDFPEQFSALKADGYCGRITLETHWRSIPLDPQSQHLPAGYAFSANAEPASRVCMAHLQRLVDAA